MKRVQTMLCVAAITTLAAACESPASSQEQAIEAQQAAEEARINAEREAEKKVVEAQAKANAEAVEARDEAARTAERAQVEAAEAQGEASQELIEARNDLRERTQSRLEGIDRAILRARADARNAGARAQTNFDEVMRDVDSQRATIQQQLNTLERQSAQGWEQFKTDFEARMDALDARLKDARARL